MSLFPLWLYFKETLSENFSYQSCWRKCEEVLEPSLSYNTNITHEQKPKKQFHKGKKFRKQRNNNFLNSELLISHQQNYPWYTLLSNWIRELWKPLAIQYHYHKLFSHILHDQDDFFMSILHSHSRMSSCKHWNSVLVNLQMYCI